MRNSSRPYELRPLALKKQMFMVILDAIFSDGGCGRGALEDAETLSVVRGVNRSGSSLEFLGSQARRQ